MKIIIIIIIISYLYPSCSYTEEATRDFNLLLNTPKPDLKNKINLGGAYHNIRKESYHTGIEFANGKPTKYVDTPYLDKPIFFFSNGLILFEDALILDSNYLKSAVKYAAFYSPELNWGTYDIHQDTVNAIIYMSYFGRTTSKRIMHLESHFKGIIRNMDTITDWHMISPNPKADSEFSMNKDYVLSLLSPKNFYFKSVPSKQLIDSNNTWISVRKSKIK